MNDITLFRNESTKNLYQEMTVELSVKSPIVKFYWLGLLFGMVIVTSTFFLSYWLHL